MIPRCAEKTELEGHDVAKSSLRTSLSKDQYYIYLVRSYDLPKQNLYFVTPNCDIYLTDLAMLVGSQ